MANCLVAQSGGPTSVINATLAGVVKANQLNPYYEKVLGGINGIEGILQERFVDLTSMSERENLILKQTPSSALGSCRYKLERENKEDFEKLFKILDKYNIETLFYIGGNDSMDSVLALSEYAKEHNITGHRFIGCPKTIDNDLMGTDHSPGYPNAAKFITTSALHTWLDVNVFTRKEVFILETMGRDAGWLAASACLSKNVDVLLLPETPFNKELFLKQVKDCLDSKNKCYVVASEGIKYEDKKYVAAINQDDAFGHVILGGAGNALKNIIFESKITDRCRVMDLSTIQRCYAGEQALVDAEESYQLGMSAHMRSTDGVTSGKMVGLKRKKGENYDVEFTIVDVKDVANKIKYFPKEWILPNYKGISKEAYEYIRPLIARSPKIIYEDGIPAYVEPYYSKGNGAIQKPKE